MPSLAIEWTRGALDDLVDILDYVASHDPRAAAKISARLRALTGALADFPHQGRPGRVEGTRELATAPLPYVVAYRVGDRAIEILAIRHGKRMWPAAFEDE